MEINMSKNKRVVNDQSIYENSNGFLTTEEIRKRLLGKSKKFVMEQFNRFKNSSLASYFTKEDLEEVVEEIIIEIADRVQQYQINPKDARAVNPRGMYQYFTKSFNNHCQKIYEKYAKTDQRAGVATVSSDEALAVAASKNLVYPEDRYVLNQEFLHVINKLEQIDENHNKKIHGQYNSVGKVPKANLLFHNAIIIQKLLEGYKPKDISSLINLTAAEYSQHKKHALELAKEHFGSDIKELSAHFDATVDHRFYYSTVKKRLKKEKRLENTDHIDSNFYIHEKRTKDNLLISLCVRLDYMIGEDKLKDIKGKELSLYTSKISLANETNELVLQEKNNLLNNIKNSETINKKIENTKKQMMKELKEIIKQLEQNTA